MLSLQNSTHYAYTENSSTLFSHFQQFTLKPTFFFIPNQHFFKLSFYTQIMQTYLKHYNNLFTLKLKTLKFHLHPIIYALYYLQYSGKQECFPLSYCLSFNPTTPVCLYCIWLNPKSNKILFFGMIFSRDSTLHGNLQPQLFKALRNALYKYGTNYCKHMGI